MKNSTEKVTREAVVETLTDALRLLDAARAMWEQGAASFGRVDEFSDVDLCVICRDDGVEAVFKAVEGALEKRFGISDKYRIPEPTWHGHSQVFIWLKGASRFLFVDMAVEKLSAKNRFLEYSIHGPPVVRMDKDGIISDDSESPEKSIKKIEGRIEAIKTMVRLFQVEVLKELERGNDLEALAFYNGMTMRPLVEALRIKHCPQRFNFHTRYAYYDLPPKVFKRLEKLLFVKDAKDLARRRKEAEKWFWKTMESIDMREVGRKLAEAGRDSAERKSL
ncbi:MAG: hypothetical protein V1934_04310 [Methanobacteriota archaeon]